jgi:hypothetical protein
MALPHDKTDQRETSKNKHRWKNEWGEEHIKQMKSIPRCTLQDGRKCDMYWDLRKIKAGGSFEFIPHVVRYYLFALYVHENLQRNHLGPEKNKIGRKNHFSFTTVAHEGNTKTCEQRHCWKGTNAGHCEQNEGTYIV